MPGMDLMWKCRVGLSECSDVSTGAAATSLGLVFPGEALPGYPSAHLWHRNAVPPTLSFKASIYLCFALFPKGFEVT